MEDIALRGGAPAVILGLAVTVLKIAGGLLALAPVRPWGRVIPRAWLLVCAGLASVVLTVYGAILVLVGALVLSGTVHPAGAVDRTALRWHAALWDMWFLLWGVLLTVATVAYWRRGRIRGRPAEA